VKKKIWCPRARRARDDFKDNLKKKAKFVIKIVRKK